MSSPTTEPKNDSPDPTTIPPPLNEAGKKFIQEVCGVFLFLARGVNGGLLPALSLLASQQANPAERTMELYKQFLDYMATQDDAILTYKASNMALAIHSNASYLSEANARSRAGGHMFMASNEEIPKNNGAVLNILQIIRAVMSSAAEAELGALEELGHPQPQTPMQTDNSMAQALLTNKLLPPQGTQSHGHEIPLATRPQGPETISLLLATGHTKSGRLFHVTPPCQPP